MKTKTPMDILFDSANLKCTLCNQSGGCDCWEKCECGWLYKKDDSCGNAGCGRKCVFCQFAIWTGSALMCSNEDSKEHSFFVLPDDLCDDFERYESDESENMGALE